MKLILSTHNRHKATEIRQMFKDLSVKILTLSDVGFHDDIEETGSSFEENAFMKAEAVVHKFNIPVLADDSGLMVEALNGSPGIYSARYAGDDTSAQGLCTKLLHDMENVPEGLRQAKFVCVMALIDPVLNLRQPFRGEVHGLITKVMKGSNGFGYDPVFYVPEEKMTMAEMKPADKNLISHRYRALQQVKQFIGTHYA